MRNVGWMLVWMLVTYMGLYAGMLLLDQPDIFWPMYLRVSIAPYIAG